MDKQKTFIIKKDALDPDNVYFFIQVNNPDWPGGVLFPIAYGQTVRTWKTEAGARRWALKHYPKGGYTEVTK